MPGPYKGLSGWESLVKTLGIYVTTALFSNRAYLLREIVSQTKA